MHACVANNDGLEILCEEIANPGVNISQFTLTEYTRKFGIPFELTNMERTVNIHGLSWVQKGFVYFLNIDSKHLVLDSRNFIGLYNSSIYFHNYGRIGNFAKCKSLDEKSEFLCNFPWEPSTPKQITKEQFIQYFVKSEKNDITGDSCSKFWIHGFWHLGDGSFWRCWNNNFWKKEKGKNLILNRREFELQIGDILFLLENQPDQDLRACRFSHSLTKFIDFPTLFCRAGENINEEYLPSWPYYIQKPHGIIEDLPYIGQPKDLVDRDYFAIMIDDVCTRFVTIEQFSSIWMNPLPILMLNQTQGELDVRDLVNFAKLPVTTNLFSPDNRTEQYLLSKLQEELDMRIQKEKRVRFKFRSLRVTKRGRLIYIDDNEEGISIGLFLRVYAAGDRDSMSRPLKQIESN